MIRSCSRCQYFDQGDAPNDRENGRCRVRPPDVLHGWPVVNGVDWCGSFREDPTKLRERHAKVEGHEENYDRSLDKSTKGVLA